MKNKLGITDAVELARVEERISKQKALLMWRSEEFKRLRAGTWAALSWIHRTLFEDVYDFAGEFRSVNISKGHFRFTSALYLREAVATIERLPQSTFNDIIDKYVEMNVAHPFREGNGRSMRLWLDQMLKQELRRVVDWSGVSKEKYLTAMERSPVDASGIKRLLESALTDSIDDREIFVKGLDMSYFYEDYIAYRAHDLITSSAVNSAGAGGREQITEEDDIMKIAVVAANGKAGRLIVAEALERGHDVTAFARRENKSDAKKFVARDIVEITADDLKGFDAVVDAFGAWTPETLPLHSTTLKHLCDVLSGSNVRLLIVGGAGSLYVNKEHTAQVMDDPNFPDAFKPLASAQAKALDELRARDDVRWTFISPACDFQADAPKSGKYLVGGEELIVNEKGESVISYADYAAAMLDEIEKGAHIKQRIGVCRA